MTLIYIDALERFAFFKRLNKPKKEIYFITHLLSVYMICLFQGYNCKLVRLQRGSVKLKREEVLEDHLAWFSESKVNDIYNSVYKEVGELITKERFEVGYVWNGMRVFQRAFSECLASHNIEVFFFEITNLPGKIQIDTHGVNARSSLMKTKGHIKKYQDELLWNAWKEDYKKTCYNKTVGQVSILRKINYWYFFDYIGWLFLGAISLESKSIFRKLIDKINFNRFEIVRDCLPSSKFAFLPLQVSSDSQIIFNYHSDVLGSIEEAKEIAEAKGLSLVVKVHPAETDIEMLKGIMTLKKRVGFYMSDINTYELVERSDLVITVNSTVGLESIILGKNVEFLGKSVFSGLEEMQVAEIIFNHYLNADYFGDSKINLEI